MPGSCVVTDAKNLRYFPGTFVWILLYHISQLVLINITMPPTIPFVLIDTSNLSSFVCGPSVDELQLDQDLLLTPRHLTVSAESLALLKMKAWIGFLTLGVGVALFIAGAVMLGVGIAKDTSTHSCPHVTTAPPNKPPAPSTYNTSTISAMIRQAIVPGRIKQNLHDFTVAPHPAGTGANDRVADQIIEKWRAAGLENFENPNYLWIKDADGKVLYQSEGVSPAIIIAEQNNPEAGVQWLAYSPNGSVTGDLVNCGEASDREFQYLREQGISLKGKIALIRYGGIFRGNKVALAQQNGAIGAILYSDPAEVAPNGTLDKDVYPNTVYMPAHAVQRGTLYTGDGDVLSPLYPSKPILWQSGSIEQVFESRANGELPSIPVLPISYTSALALLSRLGGPAAPSLWQGKLNVTYNMGPGLMNNLQTTININGEFAVKRIRNVIGYLHGIEEPDRYVIMGNHYDAWTYGAMDPNAGTATLAEVARATMQVVNETGWRPARSLMFAAWDAEEYGLIGSTEFVEEFAEVLSRRAIAYINMDCLKGNQTM
ncbi:unnamed protein product [Heligmosomoides polygyrus]|uniref:N-acetylated-alpha-linked acidic dipeptidase 2 n=1 Tax=Heligmosomoides polygyrus TaxID=6339 RepID=A0A3P8AZY7_HELPZ|nr:unnamed protein product [Heligmosomoides polygyrus]